MKVKEHYKNHLASFYSWMAGDFDKRRLDFQNFLEKNEIYPHKTKVAIDLGAGHGIQSVALHNLGFAVTAVDFNEQLLEELKSKTEEGAIKIVKTDIRNLKEFKDLKPELIVCGGDTITHLENKREIETFIADCKGILTGKGKFILSFRDYSVELKDEQRLIPVRNDENRILTCILEYGKDKVKVTDLLHEKTEFGWSQKVSSYEKVRITTLEVAAMIKKAGMSILFNDSIHGMQTMIAK